MKKTLYMECYAGISGSMAAAALYELGANPDFVNMQLLALLPGFRSVETTRVMQGQIEASRLRVQMKTGGPTEISVEEVDALYRDAAMDQEVRRLSKRMFDIYALEKHTQHASFLREQLLYCIAEFTIVAACIVDLGIDQVYCSELGEGYGFEQLGDQKVPVPVPAVLRVLETYGIPLYRLREEGAHITLVGAAIAAALCETFDENPEVYTVKHVGIGAGYRGSGSGIPDVIRALLIEHAQDMEEEKSTVCVLETNIDDASGEQIGYAIDLLMKAGARDASAFPILMKKNRPAFLLQVICTDDTREKLEDIIFHETTSIGLRRYHESRTILPRTFEKVETPYGPVTCKICTHHGERFQYPEYEEVADIARQTGKSFHEVYMAVRDCRNHKDIV